MIIIEDTRNQIGKHKAENAYFEKHGIKVVRSKLLVGDYQVANKSSISVDTKDNILELFSDLGVDHKRFSRECSLASEAGIKLYILTEELPDGGIVKWKSPVFHKTKKPMTRMNPATAMKIMQTMTEKYGTQFCFCKKADSGRVILKLLSEEEKNDS